MANFSQRPTHARKHEFAHKLTPNSIIIQELSHAHQHQIEQRIDHELSQNPALKVETESDVLEQMEPKESDDDWNEDYDKPIDEYETGDSPTSQETETWDYFDISANLEQTATQRFFDDPGQLEQALQSVDHYRIHGYLPDDADPQLQEDLAALENSISYQTVPTIYPTFEVMIEGDRVEANVIPIGNNLRYVRGFGPFSTNAKIFIKLLQERNRLLNDLAYYILEILQGDFFRQHDLDTALPYLLPVPVDGLDMLIDELSTPKENSLIKVKKPPFKIDKKYLSKLGDQLVACRFGTFPLNNFLPSKRQIVGIWVKFAIENGMVTKNEQLGWIRDQIEERVEKWDLSDIRHKFILPLKNITIDNIKYVQKNYKQTLNVE
jgi:hypothetical protein